ncbi:MAG: hypothetical protein A3C22_01200 [Candidatus Levybacteria bacterium RIFCSPHIGHO2_02_FULL_37_10]|nr:MAG: hypothetical protein A3C22_01200 [Candidatus Levybacteria bacterium RIFCSPHIGHO2_02_FULL_37_10]
MFSNLYKHSGYYLVLFIIFILGFLLAYSNRSNENLQIGIIIATTFFYVLWGIIHHLINHDLHVKIVVEYILIGVLGLTIIFFLLNAI